MLSVGSANSAFINHGRVICRFPQNLVGLLLGKSAWELARCNPVHAGGFVVSAHHLNVRQIFKAARQMAALIGQRKCLPCGLGVGARIPQAKAEPFFGDVDESMVDKARDTRCTKHVFKRLAKLGFLLFAHIGGRAVNAIFGELDFPGMRFGWIILAQPAGNDTDVSKGDTAFAVRVAEVIVSAECRLSQIGGIGMESEQPFAVAQFWDEPVHNIGDCIAAITAVTLCEVMIERDEHFGLSLFFSDIVVGPVITERIFGGLSIGMVHIAVARVEPLIVVDFVVNDEICDTAIALFAVEQVGEEPGETAIIDFFAIGRRTKRIVHAFLAGTIRDGGPWRHAVNDGSDENAAV